MSSPPHMTNIKELVETGPIAAGEARRAGGRAARLGKRTQRAEALGAVQYGLPAFALLGAAEAERVHLASCQILETIGIEFQHERARALWADAGVDVRAGRVRIPRSLLENLIGKISPRFNLGGFAIGPASGVFAPAHGATHVAGLDGARAPATADDLAMLLKLAAQSRELHLTSPDLALPRALSARQRLAMMFSLSAKAFLAPAADSADAEATLAMAEARFGRERLAGEAVMLATIVARSPLVYGQGPLAALMAYAEKGQPCIISPFTLAGAGSPASMAGTLAQVNAETLAGLAFTQLIRPGSAHVYGPQVQAVAMRSGAPMGGTAEAAQFTLLFGQMARHYGIGFRATGALSGAKSADAQAGYEANMMLHAAIQAQAQVVTRAAGQIDSGETICVAKLLLDAGELGGWHKYARGIELDDLDDALATLAEVGPQAHFLGTAHTLRNFERAFHMPSMMDFGPYEQWEAEGARDAAARAREQAKWDLEGFSPPDLPPELANALAALAKS